MPKRKSAAARLDINMTPMIDVVFQLIIFFIVTLQLDRDMLNETIQLAESPHGPAQEKREPRTIIIEIDRHGRISIGSAQFTPRQLQGLLRVTVERHGSRVPILIRADGNASHEDVRRVMDACTSVGLWRMQFAAIKEHAG